MAASVSTSCSFSLQGVKAGGAFLSNLGSHPSRRAWDEEFPRHGSFGAQSRKLRVRVESVTP